jgi:hypothetical protein
VRRKKPRDLLSYHRFIFRRVPAQSTMTVVFKESVLKLNQPLTENISAPLVIASSLLSTVAATNRELVRLIEKDVLFGMLRLSVFNDEI